MVLLDKSKDIFEEASILMPRGVNTAPRFFKPHPIYSQRAKGAHIWDVDGNDYIDHHLGHSAVILGHQFPKVIDAINRAFEDGLSTGIESRLPLDLAKKMHQVIPCAENISLATSGTEAVTLALHVSRACSKKKKIIKMEGHFHGRHDDMLVSCFAAGGSATKPVPHVDSAGVVAEERRRNVLVVPFNDTEALEKVVRAHKKEVAALIMEPVAFNNGCVLPKEGYLASVREITEDNDVILIFDEIISGFRVRPGGMGQYYNVKPDLATFGKPMANGYSISALVGRKDLFQVLAPGGSTYFGGTFNANQVSVAAAIACLDELSTGTVQEHLSKLTRRLVDGFSGIASKLHIKMTLPGLGGQFAFYFTDRDVTNFREAKRAGGGEDFFRLQHSLLERGFYFHRSPTYHNGISFSHTEEDIDHLLQALESSLKETMR